MTKTASLEGVLFNDVLEDGEDPHTYDWNPSGGIYINEHRRPRVVGGARWLAKHVELTPGEYDRCMLRALRMASQTHLIPLPKVAAANVYGHIKALQKSNDRLISQIICGPEDEKPVNDLAVRLSQFGLGGHRVQVRVSKLIPKQVIYALGCPENVGISPGTKSLRLRGIAIRNPGLVFAFKRAGKWPSKV